MSNSGFPRHLLSRIIGSLAPARLWTTISPVFYRDLFKTSPKTVTLTALPPTIEDITRLGAVRGAVRAILPATACLERCIPLPRAARSRANQAIGLFLRANMPMAGRGLVWRAEAVGEDGDQLLYRCLIVKDAHLKNIQTEAQNTGYVLVEIAIEGFETAPIWEAQPQSIEAARNWAGATFLGVVITAMMAVLFLEYRVRLKAEWVATKADQVAALQDRIATAQLRDSQAADQKKALGLQLERFTANARPLAQMSQIATTIPQDVWLSELSYSEGEWRFSGFAAGEIAATVQVLQSLPWAKSVRLDGPIVYDSYSMQSRFDITMQTMMAEIRP